jgi:prepilin-type N-terminal cleavage/methylation domain-containing protein
MMNGGTNNQKGFTLVEIMMVVIIIGILAVLAIPRYEKYTIESKLSEVAVAVGEIKTGMEKYYNSHGNKYTQVNSQSEGLEGLEQKLRIDLGGQNNFLFDIVTMDGVAGLDGVYYTGYKVIAYLSQTGKDYDYSSSDLGDRVVYYFPSQINQYAQEPEWQKGWCDDDFFVDGAASTNGL